MTDNLSGNYLFQQKIAKDYQNLRKCQWNDNENDFNGTYSHFLLKSSISWQKGFILRKKWFLNLGGNLSGSRPPYEKVVTIRVISNHSVGNHTGRVLWYS